jgi:hypothetical protein
MRTRAYRAQIDLQRLEHSLRLFYGAKIFGSTQQRSKVWLVLCKERFESQKYISDFAGQDIAAHDNEPHVAVKAVRGFLSSHLHRSLLSPKVLWDRYTRFTKELAVVCAERSWTKTNSNFGKESIWRPNGLKRIHSCKRSTPPLASRTSMPVKLSRGL